jgi:hypothetical protein
MIAKALGQKEQASTYLQRAVDLNPHFSLPYSKEAANSLKSLKSGGELLPLEVLDRSAEYRPGQGGLPTLRVETHLLAELPRDWRGLTA